MSLVTCQLSLSKLFVNVATAERNSGLHRAVVMATIHKNNILYIEKHPFIQLEYYHLFQAFVIICRFSSKPPFKSIHVFLTRVKETISQSRLNPKMVLPTFRPYVSLSFWRPQFFCGSWAWKGRRPTWKAVPHLTSACQTWCLHPEIKAWWAWFGGSALNFFRSSKLAIRWEIWWEMSAPLSNGDDASPD